MNITDLPAYKRFEEKFYEKGYCMGVRDKTPIYSWPSVLIPDENLTVGYYIGAIRYAKIKFRDVPKKYLTREFFLHTLSGAYKDVVSYVIKNPEKFDKQFFKDHIATDYYALEFEENDFSYMPLELMDEELVYCAMLRSVNARYCERRGDFENWFYSVHTRKPELLTEEMYILGARCFGAKRRTNRFLEITPEEYKTSEYYYALCLENDTPVTEDIPEEILTDEFILSLLENSIDSVKCFSESVLEREVKVTDNSSSKKKLWKFIVLNDGFKIRDITLNDERVEYFLSIYDKDSSEYRIAFKDYYKEYLRKKGNGIPKANNDTYEAAGMMTLIGASLGLGNDLAIEVGNKVISNEKSMKTLLPIRYSGGVPEEYCKKYDSEEYLLEIYKKLGINILNQNDSFYYNVVLPENFEIVKGDFRYLLKNEKNETLVKFHDVGPFYDREVEVDLINIAL